ncbi:chemotaxis protein CheB [Dyella mobilis]|uniref:protein-glutamate methylesterase n=1 Tax=Dyella mobilis TaxID=1849582 RepID=A0ABS2KHS8_9GAMM|nr:chemotaxis protein CheB [Dyella mobilis]MBM7130610.1 chemotaxis protein CheB [Dyella mobilis]GLQ97237.1 putative chemotaxis protein-glutamate methylesterase [Dyella mobilis]
MNRPQAIAIGCSAGGVDALKVLVGGLDARLEQVVLACCHSSSDTVDLLCEILGRVSLLPVIEALERHPAQRGTVHLAPSGYHLLVEEDEHFALSVDPRVNYARPSIDVMFRTAAEVWHENLIGVVLTGGNADGASGLQRIRELGGTAIVQSPSSAEMPTMPQAALNVAGADYCVDLSDIAPLINRLCLP